MKFTYIKIIQQIMPLKIPNVFILKMNTSWKDFKFSVYVCKTLWTMWIWFDMFKDNITQNKHKQINSYTNHICMIFRYLNGFTCWPPSNGHLTVSPSLWKTRKHIFNRLYTIPDCLFKYSARVIISKLL